MFLDAEFTQTETASRPSNPDFDHEKMFNFVPVTRQLVEYLKDDCLVLYVYGRQISRHSGTGKTKNQTSLQSIGGILRIFINPSKF